MLRSDQIAREIEAKDCCQTNLRSKEDSSLFGTQSITPSESGVGVLLNVNHRNPMKTAILMQIDSSMGANAEGTIEVDTSLPLRTSEPDIDFLESKARRKHVGEVLLEEANELVHDTVHDITKWVEYVLVDEGSANCVTGHNSSTLNQKKDPRDCNSVELIELCTEVLKPMVKKWRGDAVDNPDALQKRCQKKAITYAVTACPDSSEQVYRCWLR